MQQEQKLTQRLEALVLALGETDNVNLLTQIKQLSNSLDIIIDSNKEVSGLVEIYPQAKRIIEDSSKFVSLSQKKQEVLCFEPALTAIIKNSNTARVEELTKALDNPSLQRVIGYDSKVSQLVEDSADFETKLAASEADTFKLVSRYHNEISALNEILITLDTHLNKIQQSLLRPE
ncbi:hypothetical protein BB561_006275 [Smittium simulii]|uniref:Dynactin subunit 3 n=1 Tax=Smittium simulii TaxID=133385 RepID=A0A2T9Y5E7_9FUNG|nr:hypothetical protein BB561_006275 [Smittium simulii]